MSFSAHAARCPGVLHGNLDRRNHLLPALPSVAEESKDPSRVPTVYTGGFSPRPSLGGILLMQTHVPQCLHLSTYGPWIQGPGNKSRALVYRQ